MLTAQTRFTDFADLAEKLITGDFSDEQLVALLLETTPEKVTSEDFTQFVGVAARSLAADYRGLATFAVGETFDCCGTGGSGLPHFNTSTAVAFVLGAAGVPVVKFGNKAATSASGSFDLLEKLGITMRVSADEAMRLLEACNQVFLFAPQCYPALARLAPLRKRLEQRTIFNYIGPLLNPAHPKRRLLGVSDADMQQHVASYLAGSGRTAKALVVRSASNLDELDAAGANHVIEVTGDRQASRDADFGGNCEIVVASAQTPSSSAAKDNARIFQALVSGCDLQSQPAQLVCLNAGAALYAAGKADSLEQGCKLAFDLLQDGAVNEQFQTVRTAYAQLVG